MKRARGWLFWELARSTRIGDGFDEEAVAALRSEWADLQQEMLGTAYDRAAEGRELIARGKHKQASKMLTKYMKSNANDVVRKARYLVSRVPAMATAV